jgi:hypothetical protein
MFGGATISLILPKLIRSVARDGIFSFLFVAQQRTAPKFSLNDTRQARRISGQLATPTTEMYYQFKIVKGSRFGRG